MSGKYNCNVGNSLIPTICRETLQVNNKKHNLKRAKDLNRHFSEEDKHIVNKHVKRRTSFVLRVSHIKAVGETAAACLLRWLFF